MRLLHQAQLVSLPGPARMLHIDQPGELIQILTFPSRLT